VRRSVRDCSTLPHRSRLGGDEELAYRQAGTGGKPVPTLAENDQAFIKKLF